LPLGDSRIFFLPALPAVSTGICLTFGHNGVFPVVAGFSLPPPWFSLTEPSYVQVPASVHCSFARPDVACVERQRNLSTRHLRKGIPAMGLHQPWHLIIILVIVLIVFGAGKLGNIGGAVGKSVKDFKESVKDDDDVKPAKNTKSVVD
jgi:TatA/E family protein of Tat protein translocase